MAKRAVIYTRVSRDDTGEGRSVERQLAACRALAEARGWRVEHELCDNSISAWSGKSRPAWLKVLELIESGQVDVLVAWHIDRMTRSMLDLENLILLAERHGVGIATATGDIDLTTDVGRMVARILGAVARAEVERKAARQRLANEQRAGQGAPPKGGFRPFGYSSDFEVVPEEADAIRNAARWALSGVSIREIARRWEAAGLRSSVAAKGRTKQAWTPQGVRLTLLNPLYIAMRTYRGEVVGPGTWEPILDEATHYALVSQLGTPRSAITQRERRGSKPVNLLSGIAECGHCGQPLQSTRNHGKYVYRCRQAHVLGDRAAIDKYVSDRVVAFLSQPNALQTWAPKGDDTLDDARRELDELQTRMTELGEAYAAGAISLSTLTAASAGLRERLERAEETLTRASAGNALTGLAVGTEEVVERWNAVAQDQDGITRLRAIISAVCSVTLMPRNRRRLPVEEFIVLKFGADMQKAPSTEVEGAIA